MRCKRWIQIIRVTYDSTYIDHRRIPELVSQAYSSVWLRREHLHCPLCRARFFTTPPKFRLRPHSSLSQCTHKDLQSWLCFASFILSLRSELIPTVIPTLDHLWPPQSPEEFQGFHNRYRRALVNNLFCTSKSPKLFGRHFSPHVHYSRRGCSHIEPVYILHSSIDEIQLSFRLLKAFSDIVEGYSLLTLRALKPIIIITNFVNYIQPEIPPTNEEREICCLFRCTLTAP